MVRKSMRLTGHELWEGVAAAKSVATSIEESNLEPMNTKFALCMIHTVQRANSVDCVDVWLVYDTVR